MIEMLGSGVVRIILTAAGLLKEEHVPGLVALIFFIALAGCVFAYARSTRRRVRALRAASEIIDQAASEEEFRGQLPRISQEMKGLKNRHGFPGDRVVRAWDEFQETVLTPERDDEALRNGLRPALFFNADDLGMAPGFWRVVPSLFVSAGLVCTFLGLIVLLNDFSEAMKSAPPGREAIVLQGQMQEFIGLAGAKFIMSLSGLVCSMAFTILLRRGADRVENAIHGLCSDIERRVTFLSLEGLASDQLTEIREQTRQMKALNTELIEQLGRPLRHELPQAISTAIAAEMRPLMDSMSQTASSGLGDMVGELSGRFSRDVGDALSLASARLNEAADRLTSLAGSMESGGGRMETAMGGAVDKLSGTVTMLETQMQRNADSAAQAFTLGAERFLSAMNGTLEEIRRNTAQSNEKLGQVAESLADAAIRLRTEMEAAASTARSESAQTMEEVSRRASRSMDETIGKLAETVAKLAQGMEESAEDTAQRFAGGAERFLAEMNGTLEKINRSTAQSNEKLTEVAEALTEAAVQFGAEVDRAGAAARIEAERSMSEASANAAAAVEGAGTKTLAAMEAALVKARRDAAAFSESASAELLKPLEEIRNGLDAAAGAMRSGTEAAARFGDAARHGADAMQVAASGAKDSAMAFQAAASPLRQTAEATQRAAETVATASEQAALSVQTSAKEVAVSAERALQAAVAVAERKAEASEAALAAIRAALERFEAVAGRMDDIDQKLGEAFEEFRGQVETAVGTITSTSDAVHKQYSGALDTLVEVVDQARGFSPSSRRS